MSQPGTRHGPRPPSCRDVPKPSFAYQMYWCDVIYGIKGSTDAFAAREDCEQDADSGIPQHVKDWVKKAGFPILYSLYQKLQYMDSTGVSCDQRPWELFKFISQIEDSRVPTDMSQRKNMTNLIFVNEWSSHPAEEFALGNVRR